MTPDPTRLHSLDAAIAACALDAMLAERGDPDPMPATDGVPERSYDDVEVERRTWAYRSRR